MIGYEVWIKSTKGWRAERQLNESAVSTKNMEINKMIIITPRNSESKVTIEEHEKE